MVIDTFTVSPLTIAPVAPLEKAAKGPIVPDEEALNNAALVISDWDPERVKVCSTRLVLVPFV